jgi:hypothetical protein
MFLIDSWLRLKTWPLGLVVFQLAAFIRMCLGVRFASFHQNDLPLRPNLFTRTCEVYGKTPPEVCLLQCSLWPKLLLVLCVTILRKLLHIICQSAKLTLFLYVLYIFWINHSMAIISIWFMVWVYQGIQLGWKRAELVWLDSLIWRA